LRVLECGPLAGDVRLSDIEPRFATQDAAEAWFVENDPEGVAFEYEVFE
jgi:hypothetical protein